MVTGREARGIFRRTASDSITRPNDGGDNDGVELEEVFTFYKLGQSFLHHEYRCKVSIVRGFFCSFRVSGDMVVRE